MTLHPSNTFLCKDLKPEDKLSDDQIDMIRSNVLSNVGRTLAFAICGYADWLCYFCVRYLENGGLDDLEAIRGAIKNVPWELENKIINNIYFIIREIRVTQDEYENVPPRKFEKFDIEKAIDFMIEHTPKENFECITRAMSVLEDGFKKEKNNPYTKQLVEWTKKGFN